MKLEQFDHPLIFVIGMTMSMVGVLGLGTWAAKKAGLYGLASLLQHP